MGVDLKRGIVPLLLITVCGCGVKKSKNFNVLGHMVQIDAQSVESLKSIPEAQVTPILKNQNLYRVEGLTTEELEKLLPESEIVEDIYIEQEPRSLVEGLPVDDDFMTTESCVKGAPIPLPVIAVMSGSAKPSKDTIQLGESIRLTALQSLSSVMYRNKKLQNPNFNPQVRNLNTQSMNGSLILDKVRGLFRFADTENTEPPPLEFEWRLSKPVGSNLVQKYTAGIISLTPDRRGEYTVYLRVRDPITRGCAFSMLNVGVTENKSFEFKQSQQQVSDVHLQSFTHLNTIGAKQAWDHSQGENVVIAILDTGVNYNHSDLTSNIKVNAYDKTNGIDDDNNGFVDDTYGWDFVFNDNMPYDDNGHGTHVAGLAAASTFGVAKKASILPIKVGTATGRIPASNLIEGINYATNMRVDVINLSLGISKVPDTIRNFLKLAIQQAELAEIVVVSSAGNEQLDIDRNDVIPANIETSNNITVAAVDASGLITEYSNFGRSHVTIAAPGGTKSVPLKSTFLSTDLEPYVSISGTSMAAPLVSGAVALLKSLNRKLTPAEIKTLIKESVSVIPGLENYVSSAGVLNVEEAVHRAQARE